VAWVLGLFFVCILIGLVFEYLDYIILALLALGAIWLVFYFIGKAYKAYEKKKYSQAEEAARENPTTSPAMNIWILMIGLGKKSIHLFESLPEYLSSAEDYLDQAEVDFADDAFAPFWDCIENAAKALAHFDEGVNDIKDNLSRYTELISQCEDAPPRFPLVRESVAKLGVGTGTAERMEAIVRTAQCKFQFATIYEQHKTNQILVAGFTSLAQALGEMTWQIKTSIGDLAGLVNVMTSTVNESICTIHSRMGDIAERASEHRDELMEKASESGARERKVLEMLDNIQRRRKPII